MRYIGMFYGRTPASIMGLLDAPCAQMGRHALCAEGIVTDGGASAYVLGSLRDPAALRRDFEAAGMRVARDAEPAQLVLHAYRLWGEDYPTHIAGALSSVIVDQDANRLIITRDRVGETRVFYATRGGSVIFSDHPAALLRAPFVSRIVDRAGLCELFALGPARTPGRTPWRDIRALEPGCALIADERGARIDRYFQLEARPHADDLPTTVAHIRDLLVMAMEDVRPCDPGVLLSGGLDSTLLAALCKPRKALRAYSVAYAGDARDFIANEYQIERDAPYVEQAASWLKIAPEIVRLTPDQLRDALPEAVRLRGFPGMADVDTSLMLLARRVARTERSILSGECADEVFGGYPWFHRPALIAADGFPWSGSLDLRAAILKPAIREKLRLHDYAARRYHESAADQPRLHGESAEDARLRQIYGLCLAWFMPNLQERAGAMCEGLRVFTPFADDRLLTYVYNVPWSMKRLRGLSKGLLREAARGLLPEEIRLRAKSPYPKTHDPAYTARIRADMAAMLRDPDAPLLPLLDQDALARLSDAGLSASDTPWFGQLMTGPQMFAYLLQIDDWMRRYGAELDL